MEPINNKNEVTNIFNIFNSKIEEFACVGCKKWGDPAASDKYKTYEIKYNDKKVLLASTEWANSRSLQSNRYAILATIPSSQNNNLGQVFNIVFPFTFSKKFSTRLYKDSNLIEIRNYGKFTIGRRGLKIKEFFNYLRTHNLDDEILLDENNKEYICMFKIKNMEIDTDYFIKRFVTMTYIVDDYKKKMNSKYKLLKK